MNQSGENPSLRLSDEFLTELVKELDNEDIVGITLGGSYARGEATLYSDVDLACFWREGLMPPPKRFFYRQGRLISVKMTSVAEMRDALDRPQAAMLFANGRHRLLLDKDGTVARFLEELKNFSWETVRSQANWSISIWMMLKAEEVHKVLREFQQGNEPGLAYAITKIMAELTSLVAMYHGLLITSDSTYYTQVEGIAGENSAWTYYHRIALGLESGPAGLKPIRARGLAALHFYRETLAIVRAVMRVEHLKVAEQALEVVQEATEILPLTEEESRWLKQWA